MKHNESKEEFDKNKHAKSMVIAASHTTNPTGIIIKTKIEEHEFEALIDSGSDKNYIAEKAASKLTIKQLETKPINLIYGNGQHDHV